MLLAAVSGTAAGASLVGLAWLFVSGRKQLEPVATDTSSEATPPQVVDIDPVVEAIKHLEGVLVPLLERADSQRQATLASAPSTYHRSAAPVDQERSAWPARSPQPRRPGGRCYADFRPLGGSARTQGRTVFVEVSSPRSSYVIDELGDGRGDLRPNEKLGDYDPSWSTFFGIGSENWPEAVKQVGPRRVVRGEDGWQLDR